MIFRLADQRSLRRGQARDRRRPAAHARGEARARGSTPTSRRRCRTSSRYLGTHALDHLLDRRDDRRDDHDVRERGVAHRARSARCARSASRAPRSSPRSCSRRCCSACVGGVVGLAAASFMQIVPISTINFQSFAELAFTFTLTPAIVAAVAGVRAGDGLRRRLPAGRARGAAEDRRRAARRLTRWLDADVARAARARGGALAAAVPPTLADAIEALRLRAARPDPRAGARADLILRQRVAGYRAGDLDRALSRARRWPRTSSTSTASCRARRATCCIRAARAPPACRARASAAGGAHPRACRASTARRIRATSRRSAAQRTIERLGRRFGGDDARARGAALTAASCAWRAAPTASRCMRSRRRRAAARGAARAPAPSCRCCSTSTRRCPSATLRQLARMVPESYAVAGAAREQRSSSCATAPTLRRVTVDGVAWLLPAATTLATMSTRACACSRRSIRSSGTAAASQRSGAGTTASRPTRRPRSASSATTRCRCCGATTSSAGPTPTLTNGTLAVDIGFAKAAPRARGVPARARRRARALARLHRCRARGRRTSELADANEQPGMLFLTSTLIWGSTWLAITYQLGIVAPEVSVAYRFALASLCLAAVVRRSPARSLRFPRAQPCVPGGVRRDAVRPQLRRVYWAERYVASGLVAVVFSTIVFMNPIGMRLAFGTPLTRAHAGGGGAWRDRRRAAVPARARRRAARRRRAALGIAFALGGNRRSPPSAT